MNDTTSPAVLAISDDGRIHDCDQAAEALFGYRPGELVGQHISVVLPELGKSPLVRDGKPCPQLRFLCRIGHLFQAETRSGRRFSADLFLNSLGHSGPARVRLIVRAVAGPAKDAPDIRDDASLTVTNAD
jgi:PAS domain S-box-containing protein